LRTALTVAVYLAACLHGEGQNFPSTHISNGIVTADIYLPDPVKGSYRATRFDWSGIIRNLTYRGHTFFGQWYEVHDPLTHDAITGPVNIFDTPGPATGYADARTGETFLRIGVGHVEKPVEAAYRETNLYKVVDGGKWVVDEKPGRIEFRQELPARSGYAYRYSKTISLAAGEPVMILSQEMTNTGSKPIDTTVFNHGFFQIDSTPASPDLLWTFPFEPRTTGDFGGMAEIHGRQILYSRELHPGERVLGVLQGYGQTVADHAFSLENRKTGAGVRVKGDRPVTKMTFWSRRMAYSPEASIHLHIAPGMTERWQTRYEFYVSAKKESGR